MKKYFSLLILVCVQGHAQELEFAVEIQIY